MKTWYMDITWYNIDKLKISSNDGDTTGIQPGPQYISMTSALMDITVISDNPIPLLGFPLQNVAYCGI